MTEPNHIAEARKKLSRPQIREVFMRNGARIEPDRDDLPDYVYESVFELLEMAAPAVQGEPVEYQCHSCRKTTPPPAPFKAYVECDECGALTAAPIAARLTAPQPAEQPPRSDALIVEQTERVAAILAEAFFNMELPRGENFRDIENPRVRKCWRIAADIQEELTDTDVENALAELEDEQQPTISDEIPARTTFGGPQKFTTAEQQPAPSAPTFQPGDRVRKTKGSQWKGRVVGTYSTTLTPEGYAVESDTEKGSVQIYPVGALELVGERP